MPLRFSGIGLLAIFLSATAVGDTTDQPTRQLPYAPSLDLAAMDPSADPCNDLYQYACGGWIENNPIPEDRSSWSTYAKTYSDNQRYLWGILQDVSVDSPDRNPTQQLIGNYFAACMNVEEIEKLGASPMHSELTAIQRLDDKQSLGPLLGLLINHTDSSSFFVGTGSQQDAEDSSLMIGSIYAGGLGLPDRDYYFDESDDKKKIRASYVRHVEAMFILLGQTQEQATEAARTVMRIESALADATLTQVEKRDPHKVYHRSSLAELQQLTPLVDWSLLFAEIGLSPMPWLNVRQPAFMAAANEVIRRESLDDLKTYLTWGLVNTRAELLSSPFRDQDFAFYSTELRGIKEQRARWRTCVSQVDNQLGEALGREFVERNFPPDVREDARRMSLQIQEAMAERIDQLAWMSPQTRSQAHEKLNKMRDKIGYPDTWRDYSPIEINRNDYYGNVTRATTFDLNRQLAQIGQPVDLDEWFMSPATVNAYYNPSMNDINFPAGVLMPPLYDPKMDDAPNYGNTGGTIGHELVHGFDDEGRQFDGDGNLRDWWGDADAAAFEERANCIRE
ncbi:MAG TPA: M13 family metallopeptidase, partial [Xanthomonadales bacterium]|nr:M13 family metallopeptidase [Xanthomonadales bacterium]